MRTTTYLFALFAFSCSFASAQLPDIALAAGYTTACNINDVQTKLLATGRFASVDVVDVKTATPTLNDLLAYQAVLVWSNNSFQDSNALGDVMADYVDAGGGVVVAMFTASTTTTNRYLEGRWITGGYEIIQSQSGTTSTSSSLGTVLQPGHPVMAGVAAISANNAYRPNTTTLIQGSVLAQWADGKILAAAGTMPGRVDLGFFPPSSDCSAGYWNSTTDGTTLLANALESVSGGVFAISTFCDPANVNSTGLPAQMTGNLNSGSGSGLHLECSQGPSTQFGYFLVGTGSADPGTPLSQGRLCLALTAGNQFGRYNGVGGGGNSVGQFDGAGIFQNLVGSSAVGSGFDVPSALPTIGGTIQAGETWHFQLWYREAAGQSNFSNGLTVQF